MEETMPVELFTLPDGREVDCASAGEASVLWWEMSGDSPYASAASGLGVGDVVIDIGAHIGLASICFADTAPGVRILAFEPAPPTAVFLASNLARHVPDATVFALAVSSESGSFEMTHYPHASSRSTLFVDEEDDRRNLDAFFANEAIAAEVQASIRQLGLVEQRVTVEVTTINEIVARNDVEQVALLKIDVERAEMAVLSGITRDLWPRIGRVLIEVHDIDGRLGQIVGLLATLGFEVNSSQSPSFRGGSVYTVSASRS
jgi:31-O-methyltransferase